MNLKSFYRYVFLVLLSVFVFTGCGSDNGGGEFSNTTTQDTLVVKDTVHIIEENNITEVLDKITENETRNIIISKKLADTLTVENAFYIPAGIDERFPLGFSGKIKGIKKLSDDKFELELDEAYLTDIIKTSKQAKISTKLNEENFLGVIAPSIVSASKQSTLQKTSEKTIKSFIDGGVTFRSLKNSNRIEKSFLGDGDSGSVTLGEIALNLEIDLPQVSDSNDNGINVPGEQTKKEAKIVISGSLSDLELYDAHDYSLNLIDAYIEMDLAVKGKCNAEVKLEGTAEATLGNFSKTWTEVEKISSDKWGVTVSGISSDDKKGKLPIVGLVFKSPAPLFISQTNLAVNTAKSGGFIVWLYLNAKGELSLKGATGIALHTDFQMGVNKPKDGESKITKLIRPIEGQRMLEAPFIEGEAKLQFNLGLSLDVDVFFGGIRYVNTGLDFMGQNSLSIRTDGRASYGFDNLGEPWKLDGRMCIDGQLGAGMLFRANTKFGLEAQNIIKNVNVNLESKIQIPSKDEISSIKEGWVKNLWYKFPEYKKCINNEIPIAKEQSIVTSNISKKSVTLIATDKDNDSLKYTIKRPPTHGIVSGTAPTLTYTPYIGYGGEDSFTFVADDGMENSEQATVSIWIVSKDSDKDKDGIPDIWELQYSDKLDMDKDDSKEDSDGDGVSNYQEYLDNTNPTQISDFVKFILEEPITTDTSVTLKWNKRDSADSYKICIAKEPIGNKTCTLLDGGRQLTLEGNEKTISNLLVSGITYHTVIRAYDFNKLLFQTNEKTFELKSVILAPTSLQSTSTTDSITLQWDEVLNVGAYKVCMSETPITDGAKCEENGGKLLASTNTKLIINQNLQDGKTYYFRVRGIGTDALWSDEITSKLKEVSIPTLNKPTNLTATATTSAIALKWDEVTNASIYKVCMSETTISDASKCEENGGTLLSGGTSTETTITDNLNANAMYYFRVQGFRSGYDGLWSDERSIKLADLVEESLTLSINSTDISAGTAYVNIASTIVDSGSISFYDNGEVRNLDDGTVQNGNVTLSAGKHIIQVCSTSDQGTKCSEQEIIIVAETVDLELYSKLPLEGSSNAITNDSTNIIYGTTSGKLYSLNITTQESSFLSDLNRRVSGLFYDITTSRYYYSSISSGQVYVVSIDDNIHNSIYSLSFPDGLDYYKSNLYVVTNDRSGILTILNNEGEYQGTLNTGIDDIVGISHTDKFLYILSEDGHIYQTNSTTGQSIKIFSNKGLFEQGNSSGGLEGITILNNRIYVSYVNDSSVYLIDVNLTDYE